MKRNSEYVGVDEKYVDESLLGDREKAKKTITKVAKGFGIGYIVYIIIFLIIFVSFSIFVGSVFFKVGKTVNEQINNLGSQTGDLGSSIEVNSFNSSFEMYSGTSPKLYVTTLLDNVVTNNKKNSDKIITVIYNETTTTDPNEIVDLKQSFDQGKEYEVMLDYDAKGFVNKVTIKNI